MNHPPTLDELVVLAEQLSILDKVRLIERIAPQIVQNLQAEATKPRKSLRGLWRGQALDAGEIDQVRQDMWQNFPREEV